MSHLIPLYTNRMVNRVIFNRYASTFKSSASLKGATFDMKSIIQDREKYQDSLIRRQVPEKMKDLDFISENRQRQIDVVKAVNALRHERSRLGEIMKQMKQNAPEDVKVQLKKAKQELQKLEKEEEEISREMHRCAEGLPNLLDDSVPADPFQEEVVEFINCSSEKDAEQKTKNLKYGHKDIGEKLNIMDFSTASKVSGTSWYYLIGDGALLEQALIQYGLSKARQKGYLMLSPPTIVRREIIDACGFKPKDQNDEKQIYGLEDEDLSLIGTAEIPLGAYHSNTVFPASQEFPIKYAGCSRAYRAEAGARGADTKGLYRVHEFTKVELFHFAKPEDSRRELDAIKDLQIEIIKELGITAKMINMPTSDLGAPAMKKYDCEAWMPGRGKWGELTSCSNCGDYQARRLGIKYIDPLQNNKQKYMHTLNGTCIAVPRVIVAILEQNYDPDTNTVNIPSPLQKFMDGKDKISMNK